jgi:hypothetical protein
VPVSPLAVFEVIPDQMLLGPGDTMAMAALAAAASNGTPVEVTDHAHQLSR